MKTTLDIDDQLLLAAKQRALDTGSSLREVVESALLQWLKPRVSTRTPIKTIVFHAPTGERAAPPSSAMLEAAAHDLTSRRYWEKRFGYVPPGID